MSNVFPRSNRSGAKASPLNVIEGVYNNIFSTWNTGEAALESRVETFVLISTDKGVKPTNVMDAVQLLLQAGSMGEGRALSPLGLQRHRTLGREDRAAGRGRRQLEQLRHGRRGHRASVRAD